MLLRCALVVALVTPAAADTPTINGFMTSDQGELLGTVTDPDGKPVANASVYVKSSSRERIIKTDANGSYRVDLQGGLQYVFIDKPGRIVGSTSAANESVIEIRDILPPAVMAKPRKSLAWIPPYSDAAEDDDVWTRAWLMLDVNERGVVTGVKVLNAPGHDLDKIALREAFALRFEPAKDRAGHAITSLVLWSFEWPAYWWMRHNRHLLSRLPAVAAEVPCRRPNKFRAWDRDCSKPDMAKLSAASWIRKRGP